MLGLDKITGYILTIKYSFGNVCIVLPKEYQYSQIGEEIARVYLRNVTLPRKMKRFISDKCNLDALLYRPPNGLMVKALGRILEKVL